MRMRQNCIFCFTNLRSKSTNTLITWILIRNRLNLNLLAEGCYVRTHANTYNYRTEFCYRYTTNKLATVSTVDLIATINNCNVMRNNITTRTTHSHHHYLQPTIIYNTNFDNIYTHLKKKNILKFVFTSHHRSSINQEFGVTISITVQTDHKNTHTHLLPLWRQIFLEANIKKKNGQLIACKSIQIMQLIFNVFLNVFNKSLCC